MKKTQILFDLYILVNKFDFMVIEYAKWAVTEAAVCRYSIK